MAGVSFVTRKTSRPAPGGIGRSGPVRRDGMGGIAVCVTCHGPHLGWLAGCLESIDAQEPAAAERVVALDGCTPPPWLGARPGWQVVTGQWGHPAGGRNAGLAATSSPWMVWWDADNLMPPGYLAAAGARIAEVDPWCAIYYPDLDRRDPETMAPVGRMTMPEYDYTELRRSNFVDTAAVWRREAVEQAGGWTGKGVNEDWGLALAITALGWDAARLRGPAVIYRDGGRHQGHPETGLGWHWRTLGIVTLLSGRGHTLADWQRWLNEAELPPKTRLYVVDNAHSDTFGEVALAGVNTGRFGAVTVLRERERPAGTSALEIHRHVAWLYNRVLPMATEDLILTLEDDVIPPLHALRDLAWGMPCGSTVGAVAGAYETRGCPGYACAAMRRDYWADPPRMDTLPKGRFEVGYAGGGCTLYGSWALQHCLPMRAEVRGGRLIGWDALTSERIREAGYKVLLDGNVVCEHRV